MNTAFIGQELWQIESRTYRKLKCLYASGGKPGAQLGPPRQDENENCQNLPITINHLFGSDINHLIILPFFHKLFVCRDLCNVYSVVIREYI
jgi:hypothetical protein